jgi:hypothetical protein
MLPCHERNGIGVVPWSPLARELLAHPHDEAELARDDETTIQRPYRIDLGDSTLVDDSFVGDSQVEFDEIAGCRLTTHRDFRSDVLVRVTYSRTPSRTTARQFSARSSFR